MTRIRRRRDPAERFWSHVDKSGEHWSWAGPARRFASGTYYIGTRRLEEPMRKAWELTHGPIPAGLKVIAACGTTGCLRHLTPGTQADLNRLNWQLGKAEGFPRGEEHPVHRLTEREVLHVWHSDAPSSALAAVYGVSAVSIRNIRRGRTWGWLTGASREAA